MLDFLSNRATAAHLALAAIAPLVLCKYFLPGAVFIALLWLALIAAVWSYMAPSKGDCDYTAEARYRFLGNAVRDPALWAAVLFVVYCAVTELNSGVSFGYDPELKTWSLLPPPAPLLPGSVRGGAGIPFAGSLLALAVYPAVAHSLDFRQSVYAVNFASTIVMLDAVFSYAAGFGIPFGASVAYGLWALAAAAAMFSAERSRQRPKELLSALALAGCLSALLFAGRPAVACVFVAAVLLVAVLFPAFMFRELGFVGIVRGLLLVLVAAGIAAVLFQCLSGEWEALIPVWSTDSDPILKRFALEAWETSPWIGHGAGSFPLVSKLAATAEDWATLGPIPDFYCNGWRALLAERGIVGLAVIAGVLGSMSFVWFRHAFQRGFEHFAAAVLLFPVALAAVSVAMVFDSSALRVEAIVAFAAVAAFSVNGGQ